MFDIAVVGLGPAGRSLAARSASHGLSVLAIDPQPHRDWPATYGIWARDLPEWLSSAVIAARHQKILIRSPEKHRMRDDYLVLDNTTLRQELPLAPNRVCVERSTVSETCGELYDRAWNVIDARGNNHTEVGVARQVAFGVVVGERQLLGTELDSTSLLMDWTEPSGPDFAWNCHERESVMRSPSFLYAVRIGNDKVLLEETILATRHEVRAEELRPRLRSRLMQMGVDPVLVDRPQRIERVYIDLEASYESEMTAIIRERGPDGVLVGFGAKGGFVHPASGYSLGLSLREAERWAAAIAGSADASSRASTLRWLSGSSVSAASNALHRVGLEALLQLDQTTTQQLFTTFSAALLPIHQEVYLDRGADWKRLSRAMLAMWWQAPITLRLRLFKACHLALARTRTSTRSV